MPDDRALARRLLPLLDLTCLDEDAPPAAIAALCARADGPHGRVAAVCVYPEHVERARTRLPQAIPVATVVNFPDGGEDPDRVAREIRRVRAVGADEIDAVIPWRALLRGDEATVGAVLRAAREASRGAVLKLILESGEMETPERITRAAGLALDAGADFLKTSTGKARIGATPAAAHAMLAAIRARRQCRLQGRRRHPHAGAGGALSRTRPARPRRRSRHAAPFPHRCQHPARRNRSGARPAPMGSRQPVAGYRGVDGSVQRVNANADRAGPGGGIPAWHRQPASTRSCRSAVILAGRGRAPAPGDIRVARGRRAPVHPARAKPCRVRHLPGLEVIVSSIIGAVDSRAKRP